MKVLCFGSLNIDHVYGVPHIVVESETLASHSYSKFAGGKGLNQAIALKRAGLDVYHAGKIGADGLFLKEALEKEGVKTHLIKTGDTSTGHAIIQVTEDAENCILLYSGANKTITVEEMKEVLSHFSSGDLLVLQNEINDIHTLVELAFEKGLRIALNPSPLDKGLDLLDYHHIDYLILNEIEGTALSGEADPEKILTSLVYRYPHLKIVLTLGKKGAYYYDQHEKVFAPALLVKAVDTTAAGDTFMGYFLSGATKNLPLIHCLELASKASSIAVTRKGASDSIPHREELDLSNYS